MEKFIKEFEDYGKNKRIKYVLSKDFNAIGWDMMKEYIKYESSNTCSKCGLSKWNGVDIPLEINHIDGDNTNNEKSNLEPLCPNCHALTENWRGRNKRVRKQISNKELLVLLLENDWNMRRALIEAGLSPKGGNYVRCHKIKNEYDEFGQVFSDIRYNIDPSDCEIHEIYNSHNSIKEIIEKFGVSKSCIQSWFSKNNLRYELKTKAPDKNELIDKFEEFKTFTAVGVYYKVSDVAVRKWCDKYGILDEVKKIKNKPLVNKEDLFESFVDLKMLKLVCEKYGVSDKIMHRWCKYYGILEDVRNIYLNN